MLEKSEKHEVWFHVNDGKIVGLAARVPELLRLNLISAGPEFTIEDLNKWLYITLSGLITVYDTLEEVEADLA